MVDTSKLPISRVDELIDKLSEINNNITNINTSLLQIDSRLLTLESRRYITETYSEGTNWYRIWSDGWIEQGGTTAAVNIGTASTVTFNKSFTNTSYQVIISLIKISTDDENCVGNIYSKTINSFTFLHRRSSGSGTDTYATDWYACGY